MLVGGLGGPRIVRAQNPNDRFDHADRYDRNGRYDAYTKLPELDAGTFITVRTRQAIDTDRRDGRVFDAIVESDVWDDDGRLAIPVIRRGSPAELLVRSAPDGDLILDMESVTVDGQRYAVLASPDRIEARGRVDNGNRAPELIGGGALLGTIIGAIAGGGKGAAIGAAAGAAAGAGASLMTHGRFVRVPAGSVLTFRLDQRLTLGVRDDGFERGQVHYHR
jgi:hypothetical protein